MPQWIEAVGNRPEKIEEHTGRVNGRDPVRPTAFIATKPERPGFGTGGL